MKYLLGLAVIFLGASAFAKRQEFPTLPEFQALVAKSMPSDVAICEVENSTSSTTFLFDRTVLDNNFQKLFDVTVVCDGAVIFGGTVNLGESKGSSEIRMIVGRQLINQFGLRLVSCEYSNSCLYSR